MEKVNKLGVALVKKACRICGKSMDGPIIMNSRLSVAMAQKVEKLHGKTIGYAKEPCQECQDMMKQGILLVGVVEAKTDDHNNPYRSGNRWVVKEDFIKRAFGDMAEKVINKGVAFFSVETAHKMGFPDCNLDA